MDIDFDAVRRVFLVESEEHLAQMEQALVLLETRPDDAEAVDTIFRGAHSIKGNASSLGFEALAERHAQGEAGAHEAVAARSGQRGGGDEGGVGGGRCRSPRSS